jgi:hypothetical protein
MHTCMYIVLQCWLSCYGLLSTASNFLASLRPLLNSVANVTLNAGIAPCHSRDTFLFSFRLLRVLLGGPQPWNHCFSPPPPSTKKLHLFSQQGSGPTICVDDGFITKIISEQLESYILDWHKLISKRIFLDRLLHT